MMAGSIIILSVCQYIISLNIHIFAVTENAETQVSYLWVYKCNSAEKRKCMEKCYKNRLFFSMLYECASFLPFARGCVMI